MPRSRPPPLLAALAALLAFALTAPLDSYAQDEQPSEEVAPAEPAAEPIAAPATAPETAAPAAGDAEAIDWKAEAVRAKDEALVAKNAYDAYRSATDPNAKRIAIFALLLAATNVLLSVFKIGVGLTARGKKWLPWVAAGAGVATGLLAKLAVGEPAIMSILYGLGPPLAVLAQEMMGKFKKPRDAPAG